METRCANTSAPEAVIALTVPCQRWTAPGPKRPRIEPRQRAACSCTAATPWSMTVGAIAIDSSLDEATIAAALAGKLSRSAAKTIAAAGSLYRSVPIRDCPELLGACLHGVR